MPLRNPNPTPAQLARRAHYERNRDTILASQREYRAAHRLEASSRARTYYRDNKDSINQKTKQYKLAKRYGLTPFEFTRLCEEAAGRCAICGQPTKVFCIDHDHATGIIRGLLCSPCNTGLGHFKDSVIRLSKAIEYLSKNQSC